MKLTQILLRQHIGWHLKQYWRLRGKKKIMDTVAFNELEQKGIPVFDPKDLLNANGTNKLESCADVIDKSKTKGQNQIYLTYNDNNVLLQGLEQAKSLTKTVQIESGLPSNYVLQKITKQTDAAAKRIILNSHLFDAEQQKLPKRKDPERPAWNFPRDYGITFSKRYLLMMSKLLQLVETSSTSGSFGQKLVLDNLYYTYPFEKLGDQIQLHLRSDTTITSSKPLTKVTDQTGLDIDLPNLYPIKDTVTLNLVESLESRKSLYPVNTNLKKHHPHTIFVHYDPTEVKNIYEEEVTENQIFGRSLMKSFAVAASYAKNIYGEDTKELPIPVTIQCVQTNCQWFHFGVFQLNTLDFGKKAGIRNLWYQTDLLSLFSNCSYVNGKPTLEGYNNDVIKHIFNFYENV